MNQTETTPRVDSNSRERLLRRAEVELSTGLSKSAIYREIQKGSFPRPIRLTARSVRWPQSKVQAWIQDQIAARGYGGVGGAK